MIIKCLDLDITLEFFNSTVKFLLCCAFLFISMCSVYFFYIYEQSKSDIVYS